MIVFLCTTVAFILIALISVLIRVKSAGKYEVKLIDVLLGIIPMVLWLLFSGKIAELHLGDLKIKMNEEFQKTIAEEIKLKKNTILDGKRSLKIGTDYNYAVEVDFIDNRTELGGTTYKYIVMEQDCNNIHVAPKFWGIISFEDYNEYFLNRYSKTKGKDFLSWVKEKNVHKLESLPSFVKEENAITLNTDKLSALEKMENLNVEFLPVIDSVSNKFLGVVTKTNLASSFLINIGKDLKKNNN